MAVITGYYHLVISSDYCHLSLAPNTGLQWKIPIFAHVLQDYFLGYNTVPHHQGPAMECMNTSYHLSYTSTKWEKERYTQCHVCCDHACSKLLGSLGEYMSRVYRTHIGLLKCPLTRGWPGSLKLHIWYVACVERWYVHRLCNASRSSQEERLAKLIGLWE